MNVPIVRLFTLFVVLFGLLVAWTSRWTVFEQEALSDHALNRRGLLEEQRIHRGPIRARDGTLLAGSERRDNGTYVRRYPQRGLFAHAVGYSFLTVGRAALEQSRNDALTGERDEVTSLIDQLTGRERVGDEVRTTLDPGAQRVALQALGDRRGAVVALEPQTGAVRVMASVPGFDQNVLRGADSLEGIPDGAAVNRTTQGQYPPGSTFKVVTAVAAIDSGRYTPTSQVDGSSPKTISGTPLQNFGGRDFGPVSLTTALTHSVNTVWAEVAVKLGGGTMQDYMERFGFYEQVPVDLPDGERAVSGVRLPGEDGFVGVDSGRVDVGRVAIGQGGLLATPLQMAMVAAAIANDGTLMTPHITDRVVDRDGRTVERVEPEVAERVMKESTAAAVGDMMADVVNEGTGTAAALQGVSVAGKTGTAEIVPATNLNQPWFIAFAPRERPRFAIAVTIERSQGGQGGTEAAPIARQVLEELLR